MKSEVMEVFKAGRRVSTPIIAIETADVWAFTERVRNEITEKNGPAFGHKLVWDSVRGIRALDEPSKAALSKFGKPEDLPMETSDPVEMLKKACDLPGASGNNGGTILMMVNLQQFFNVPFVTQGVSNLRDLYKKNRRTLLLLGPRFMMPPELQSDVVLLQEKLPTDEQIAEILLKLYKAIDLTTPNKELVAKAVDAARGLSAFAVEQVFAMSLRKEGIDLDDCWQRKEAAINQTRGLKLSRGGKKFSDLGGLDEIKRYMTRHFNGRQQPRVVVFMDEIDKAMAGVDSDTSGVTQDAYGTQLKWMEDGGHDGALFLGPGGSGKTAFGNAIAAEFGVPFIALDHGGMKGSLVGESEGNIRTALDTIDGIAGEGGAFVIATCNKLEVLPTPLRRRFTSGIWYFDIPTPEEQKTIWEINMERYEIPKQPMPDFTGWTGAEIRNCCRIARQHRINLGEASRSIIPVMQSDRASVSRLRDMANGTFLSVSHSGAYVKTEVESVEVPDRAVLVTAQEVKLPKSASVDKKGGN